VDPVALTHATLLTLVRWRQAEPHPVLAATPSWHGDEALDAFDELARDELARHHLVDRRGRLDPALDDAIAVLVRPEREHYGWINTSVDGEPHEVGLLAVAAYKVALVLAYSSAAERVVLARVPPSRLTDAFVEQLPSAPPAEGEPVSMRYADYLTATEETDEFVSFRTRRDPAAQELRAILALPRSGAGNLYTAIRDHMGTRVRGQRPVNYIDTPKGRWLTVLSGDGDQVMATAMPATPRVIAEHLGNAVTSA
jgi:hypothetical protein